MRWAVGLTTVKESEQTLKHTQAQPRRTSLLPRTLASLRAAGFAELRLFVDGDDDGASWSREFGLPVTARGGPHARTAANWVLSLYETYHRDPDADAYLIAQDDLVCVRNLREYLERNPWPGDGYANLFVMPSNAKLDPGRPGWYASNQLGRGAVLLAFTRKAVVELLGDVYLVARAQDHERGHRAIDGGIVECFRNKGRREFCHSPSLCQHTGDVSVMQNRPHPKSPSFPGERFDPLTLLEAKP